MFYEKATTISLISVLVVLIACSSVVDPPSGTWPGGYYEPDSDWKVVENLEYAYNAKDLSHYMSCFREDFVFHLSPLCSQPPDTTWDFDVEQQFHEAMFGFVDDIDLEFTGNMEYIWSGDSTGQSLVLERDFLLKVYYMIPGSSWEGAQASGIALFICRPDSNGNWYVWQWWDFSDTSRQGLDSLTWTEIKWLF